MLHPNKNFNIENVKINYFGRYEKGQKMVYSVLFGGNGLYTDVYFNVNTKEKFEKLIQNFPLSVEKYVTVYSLTSVWNIHIKEAEEYGDHGLVPLFEGNKRILVRRKDKVDLLIHIKKETS